MSNAGFVDSEAVFEFLLGFVNLEKGQATELKLDRMKSLALALGSPELTYPTIHVAGSKGKGSVSMMIARILEASGRRVGLYTSPHILRWKERISLAGEEMPEELIISAAERVAALVEGKTPSDFEGNELPTYFELSTLLAFEAFRLAGCDIAVIETGLGGRFDSTNIVEPLVSVITPIELEHTEWLGDTVAKIAFEKAGIIKAGKPVAIADQVPEADQVFAGIAAERGSSLYRSGNCLRVLSVDISRSGTTACFEGSGDCFRVGNQSYTTPLIGEVQAANMGLALLATSLALEALGGTALDEAAARKGLAKASLPARFEILRDSPPLVVDGAHTPVSVAHGLAAFAKLFPGPAILLFACAKDKKHGQMAGILAPHFGNIVITTPGTFKQSDPAEVWRSFKDKAPGTRLVADTSKAFAECLALSRERKLPLFVTGSFYLAAEVIRAVSGEA
ncbi:MAG: folylpolyglutamate synthase/dihydrofolate synthase family protein [Spirochaetota bacterium]